MHTHKLGWKEIQGIQNPGNEDSEGNIIADRDKYQIFGRIILQSSMTELINQKIQKLKLKRKWMKTRKVLIFCTAKWKKLSRR
jgi:hypothetical protein